MCVGVCGCVCVCVCVCEKNITVTDFYLVNKSD